ncbi:S41 family peptidase [Actinomadura roseirufa]|uniref:S41 family peptidase n=1 Tax=Actinomadura roseirufa TaxID=2094049 RepID=UPI001041353A|nr:S41 family peptidase [Actinomadura roseirufa]
MKITGIIGAGAAAAAVLALVAPAVPAEAAATGVDGLWRSDGYNYIFAVDKGKLTSYQTTSISCLPADVSGDRLPGTDPARARFGRKGKTELVLTLTGRNAARLLPLGSAAPIGLHRLSALPARCGKPAPKDPLSVFDVYWTTYAENYPFFKTRKVDWQKARAKYRPKVGPKTSDKKLFGILADMTKPLGDAHTSLDAGDAGEFEGLRRGTRTGSNAFTARTNKAIGAYLGVPLQSWGNGQISYGDLPDGLGYLRINRFVAYKGKDIDDIFYSDDSAELGRALDSVFTKARVRSLKGLVIDVRNNGGGYDALGLQIASRLTDAPYLAYVKAARDDPKNPSRFTTPQRVTVRPAHAPAYRGPVAVLTSDLSVSAAETFTQAMMGRTPRPTRIGANTQGVFSDVLSGYLPNGWAFGLGNERYADGRGHSFEGPGIAPDVRTPVFTEDELTHNRDSAIAKARQILTQARP